MDAIILVGGQGTRLRPLTARRHKSLVPVLNQPALDHLLAGLAQAGIERTILAIGLGNADLAAAYPEGRFGDMRIQHVVERERRESGGAIKGAVAEAGITGRFVVLNGDIFTADGPAPVLAAHEASGAELTMALSPVDDPSQYGIAVLDERRRIARFLEKPPPGSLGPGLANAGIWVFEPGLAAEIPGGAARVEETLFPALTARRALHGHILARTWADYGTPERYLSLHQRLLGGARASVHIARGARVAATAVISRSAVGAGTSVGDRATVDGSVLWESVVVHEEAQVRASVLANGVTIGARASVEGAFLGAGAIVDAGAHVPAGARLQPGARYHGGDD